MSLRPQDTWWPYVIAGIILVLYLLFRQVPGNERTETGHKNERVFVRDFVSQEIRRPSVKEFHRAIKRARVSGYGE